MEPGREGDRVRSPIRALELRTNLRSVPHSSATMRELFDPLKRVFGLHVLCMVMSWNALFSHYNSVSKAAAADEGSTTWSSDVEVM